MRQEEGVNGVGPPASSVSASRVLLLPEAFDFENSITLYDTIFSNYYSSSRTGDNPAAFLGQFFQESSGSSVTLICYVLVLLRLRVQL